MTAVWVVREDGKVEAAFPREDDAVDYRHLYGAADMTVTRETILTPAHAAVIDAAVVMADHLKQSAGTESYHEWMVARNGLLTAVATLRKHEAEV